MRPGENLTVRGDRRYDAPEGERELAPFAPVPEHLRGGVVRSVALPPGKKLIALTFDLCEVRGEVAGYDGAIIDTLRANSIKATFFAGGKWMRSHAERAGQLMSDPLFEIANHSEAHRNLRLLEGRDLSEEILGAQRSYERLRGGLGAAACVSKTASGLGAIPPRLALFRFPFGACSPASLAAVNDAGLVAVQWDLSTGDPSPAVSARAIAEAMVRGAKPGSIIILHANGRGWHTADALPDAIPRLKAKGFEFVTVSELLSAGRPEVVPTCYDNRPGDTDKYDMLFLAKHHGRAKRNGTLSR